MYRDRMLGYYPNVISAIKEFRSIVDSEYPEFEDMKVARETTIDNAYLSTMGEERVTQWEQIFKIKPTDDSSIEDRRETIMARIRGQGKLNTALINLIVKTFTGGTATSWIEDSTLYINILPPSNGKNFKFENVVQEIKPKVPAHLGLSIEQSYYTWGQLAKQCATWNDVYTTFENWEEVYLFVPTSKYSRLRK